MPLSSYQVSSMMSGQQQMFANYAAYAGQISPEGPPGMMGYGAPLGQQAPVGPPPTFDRGPFESGPRIMAGMHAAMPAMMGAGVLAGSFIPGVGRHIGMLDPMQAALSGFGRASGMTGGIKAGAGLGEMFGGMAENLGRIGAGGMGNIARAGMMGVGGAALAFLPPFIGMKAAEYMGGQMVEGAQFTSQVQRTLGQNFRFNNPLSQTGYGFSREQGAEIAGTVRQMGNREIMSSPQEMLRIMEQGIQGGLFRPVQDAKAFQTKFKDMVGALKEIAKTFNTTLEGAMPFLQEGRRMGFWTPSDVMRMAASTRATAATTGMTVAQVQQMQEQGAGMARSVGAQGAMGALGMQRTMDVVGGGLRSGVISEQRMAELTGGLQGSEAVAALSGTLQAGTTRFASSRTARWLLAATANKSMTGLDEGKLGMLASGRLNIGQIRGMAEKGVQGRGADFLMGEEEMRGDLLKRGPEAQAGFIAGIAGNRLHGESGMDKLVTRRLIQRYFGGDARQADAMAELARNMPQIMRENSRRVEAMADQQARSHGDMMEHSYEGLKRKVSSWTKQFIEDPLQQAGASFSQGIGDMWERATDAIWGRAPRGLRSGGIDRTMARAMSSSALGDTGAMHRAFATSGEMQKAFGAGGVSREMAVKTMEQQVGELAKSMRPEAAGGQNEALSRMATLGAPGAVYFGAGVTANEATLSGVQNKLLDVFKGPEGSDFKEALTYFSNGSIPKSEGGNPGDTAIGVAKLAEMERKANERKDFKSAALYKEMQKPEHHKHLAKMGDTQRQLNTADSIQVIRERSSRALDSIGRPNVQGVMAQIDTISAKGGKEGIGLGKIIKGLLTGAGGEHKSIEAYQDALKKLTQAAEGADPTQLMDLIAKTSGMSGMSSITEALSGAADVQGLKEAYTGRGKGAGGQAAALSKISGKLGFGDFMSKEQLIALQGHPHDAKRRASQEKVEADLLSKLKLMDPEQQQFFKEMIKDVKGGDKMALFGLAEKATAMAAARTHSDPSMDALARFKQEKSKDIIGKLGSTEGMHSELMNHTGLLRELVRKAGGKDPTKTDNPQSHEDDTRQMSVQ